MLSSNSHNTINDNRPTEADRQQYQATNNFINNYSYFKLGFTRAVKSMLPLSIAGTVGFICICLLLKSGGNFWQSIMPLVSNFFNHDQEKPEETLQQAHIYKH